MPSVAIVGASGYAGGELIRLVHGHPHLDIGSLAAGSNAGARVSEVHPQFAAVPDLADRLFVAADATTLALHDVVFLALPHGQSAALVAKLPDDVRVVDLGADFRLADPEQWERYYGGTHAGQWTYGLPEVGDLRAHIAESLRVANPGCYATAIQVGLAPVLVDDLADSGDIVVVAASGSSGAGRSALTRLLASEVVGSMTTYKIGGTHQHTPEIEQTLEQVSGSPVRVNFTPMLAPMSRGILATMSLRSSAGLAELRACLLNAYADEPFVHVLAEGEMPATAATYGSNAVHVQVVTDEHTGRATVVTALDNLVKGAAGQALQNANIMFGFPETTGLSAVGVAP